jgi:micrococcal nuclease
MRTLAVLAAALVVACGAITTQHAQPRSNAHQQSAPLSGGQRGTIKRVVDGDTVHVTVNGQDVDVRLLGINTPEVVDPRKPVMCGGREASANMHRLAPVGAPARVVTDPTTHEKPIDKYQRTLAYLYVRGVNVDARQVADGWAQVNGYGHPFRLHAYFDRLAKRAKNASKGVYGKCGGDFSKPAS